MKTNRRGFLKIAAAAGCAGLVGNPAKALAKEFTGWPDRLGMLTDTTLCIGCRKCEAACNEVNNLPSPATSFEDKKVFNNQRRTSAYAYTVVNRFPDPTKKGEWIYSKIQCNHCNEPACASACLVGAFKKTREGAVKYNKDVCIGCRYCMVACPFNIPAYEYNNPFTPEVRKCTLCLSRIQKGEVPACASICPREAITYGKRNQLIKVARERIRKHPDRYADHIYGENEVGGTSWMYLSKVPLQQVGFRTDLGTTQYPQLTKGFLSAVPLVLVIWPALLGGCYVFTRHRERQAKAEAKKLKELMERKAKEEEK